MPDTQRLKSEKSRTRPRPAGRLGKLLKVLPGEGQTVLLLGGAILATEAGYWMGGNGVDGLVFGRFGSGVLPYLLMLKGVLAFLAVTLYSRWLVLFSRTRMLFLITFATLLLLLLGRTVIALDPPDWFFFVLWPLSYVVPDLFLVQTWALAGESFDSRQNKRLFPLVTALGAVGVVAGNFLTYPLVHLLGSPNLLLVWVGLVLFAFGSLYTVRRRVDRNQARRRGLSVAQAEKVAQASVLESLRVGFAVVRYYKIIGLMVLSTGLTYLLYYALFKIYVTEVTGEFIRQYPNEAERTDAITGFFGLVAGFSTLLAFALGLLVVNRLFARLGVRNLVLAMPLTNLLVFGAILLFSGFQTVVAARFVHLLMTEAVGISVNQTIYNLLPLETREAATPFNNQGVSKQGGIVLAGFLLLLSLVSLQLVLFVAFGLALLYLWLALRMRSLYRPSLVQLLREGQQNFFTSDEAALVSVSDEASSPNGDSLHAAVSGLSDSSEGTRRLSAELLGQMGTADAVPPLLKAVVMDNSPEVRRSAISALVQLKTPSALPSLAQSLNDPDAGVRAEAALALRRLGLPLDYSSVHFLGQSLSDRDPLVRREAALTMLAYGHKGEALVTLWEMNNAEDAPSRREAAAAYGYFHDRVLIHCLAQLLDDFQSEVRRQAAHSLGRVGGRVAIKALLENLEDPDPAVREEIALALAGLRHEAILPLLAYLYSSTSDEGAACALHGLTQAKVEARRQGQAWAWERQLQERQAQGGLGRVLPPDERVSRKGQSRLPEPLYRVEGQVIPAETAGYSTGFKLSEQEEARLLAYGQRQLDLAARLGGYLAALNALDLAGPRLSATGPARARRDPQNLSVLLKSLKERYDAAILRVVGVVGLLGDVEALALVATGLQAQGRRAARLRADAIEALENFGEPNLTPRLVLLLEGREPNVLNAQSPGRTMSEMLLEIWRERDAWLQACVLHVIGLFELRRLRSLVAEAIQVEGENDYLIEETGQESLKRLDGLSTVLPVVGRTALLDLQKDTAMSISATLSTMSRILLLQKVPIFAGLRPEDLRRVALVCKERLFAPGDIICYEDDPGDELYIVVSGQVQVVTGFGSETHRVLAINGEGEAVGMMAILDDIPRSATLRAHGGPVRLLILSADEFKRILRERPEMAAEVIRVLSRLLRDTNKRLQENQALSE